MLKYAKKDYRRSQPAVLPLLGARQGMSYFLCWSAEKFGYTGYNKYNIHNLIPEFNSLELCGASLAADEYWWYPDDIKSRLDAFDHLITLYSFRRKNLR